MNAQGEGDAGGSAPMRDVSAGGKRRRLPQMRSVEPEFCSGVPLDQQGASHDLHRITKLRP